MLMSWALLTKFLALFTHRMLSTAFGADSFGKSCGVAEEQIEERQYREVDIAKVELFQLRSKPRHNHTVIGSRQPTSVSIDKSEVEALPTPKGAKNVLFIVVDDLRPTLNHAYNFSLVHTPELDEFSRESLTFTRAYCQYAYCSPSRNSFMTGRYPDTTRVWEFHDHFRQVGASWTSLPQYFKKHGYMTLGSGKLFHESNSDENVGMPNNDYPTSWSPEYPYLPNRPKSEPYSCANPAHARTCLMDFCEANVDKEDRKLGDQKARDYCIRQLRLAKQDTSSTNLSSPYAGKPFFVGCGFSQPHNPWHVPKEFFEIIPSWEEIPLARNRHPPTGMPELAWHAAPPGFHALAEASNDNNTNISIMLAKKYRWAYYAAVSYQSYNIGRVLDTLKELGFANTTLTVLLADHGWHLGEYGIWSKMTNFELSVRVPLIIRAPWKGNSARGRRTKVFAELVDLYATMVALAGLPSPSVTLPEESFNSTSLEPAFDGKDSGIHKDAAFSQYSKMSAQEDPVGVNNKYTRNQTAVMGYSVRVELFRYTVWFAFDQAAVRPNRSCVLGRELYSHQNDSGLWLDDPSEDRNLVDDPNYSGIVKELHARVLGYIRL